MGDDGDMRGLRRLLLLCLAAALGGLTACSDDIDEAALARDALRKSVVPYLTAGYDPGIGGVRIGWLLAPVAPRGYEVRRIGPLDLATPISEATVETTGIVTIGPEALLHEDLDIVPGNLYGYSILVDGSKVESHVAWVPVLSEFAGIPVAAPEVDEACSTATDPAPYHSIRPADPARPYPAAASAGVAWQAQLGDPAVGTLSVGTVSAGGAPSFPSSVTAGFIRGCETRDLLFDARPIAGTPYAVRVRGVLDQVPFDINYPNDAAEERVRLDGVSPEPGKILRPGWHRFDAKASWRILDLQTRQLTWLLIGHKIGGGTRILDARPVTLSALQGNDTATLSAVVTPDLYKVTFAARFTIETPDAVWIEDFVQYAVVP